MIAAFEQAFNSNDISLTYSIKLFLENLEVWIMTMIAQSYQRNSLNMPRKIKMLPAVLFFIQGLIHSSHQTSFVIKERHMVQAGAM